MQLPINFNRCGHLGEGEDVSDFGHPLTGGGDEGSKWANFLRSLMDGPLREMVPHQKIIIYNRLN